MELHHVEFWKEVFIATIRGGYAIGGTNPYIVAQAANIADQSLMILKGKEKEWINA